MNDTSLQIAVIGLSVTSSWGNGHATTYRGLLRELARLGHNVEFFERDVAWYAEHRDLPTSPHFKISTYGDLDEFRDRFWQRIRHADAVILGSYVPQGVELGTLISKEAKGVKIFYDIDTPVTLAKLAAGDYEYLTPELIREFDLYLSFTGGPVLHKLEKQYQSPCARVLHCSVDTDNYYPEQSSQTWDLGYLGTYSADRQPKLEKLMFNPADKWSSGKFVVAGPMYPEDTAWPGNVEHIDHLPPTQHRDFYNSQRFTLNVTREQMVGSGYSPSVRLFEAAACGTPIISDDWEGLTTLFTPGKEMIICDSGEAVYGTLSGMSDDQRISLGNAARQRVLAEHTAVHRAQQLQSYLYESIDRPQRSRTGKTIAYTSNGRSNKLLSPH